MSLLRNRGLAGTLKASAVLVLPFLLLALGPRQGSDSNRAPALEALLASQDPFDKLVGEVTVRALVAQAGPVDVCLHPDTRPEDAERILRSLAVYFGEDDPENYYLRGRWTQTATNPTTGTTGNPITLTWSFVPDGTDADGGPSDLFAVFNAAWGGTGWQDKIRNAFSRWQAVIGITYIEVSDDGADLPDNYGQLGVRGDVRLSGRWIDGPSNVLAYNYYPNVGDMVLDTGDVDFYHSPIGNYGNLKNVICHEHGHGMGLGHVTPTDCTKLMEPYICGPLIAVGPRDDDVRGGMRNYGDRYENNDTNGTPTVLGAIGDSLVVIDLSIDNGNTDVDWYKVTLEVTDLTIEVDPVGSSYYVGPDGGVETWVATDSISDPDIELYNGAGTTLLASATSGGIGATEVLEYTIVAPGDFSIKVYRKAGSGSQVQRYTMKLYTDDNSGVPVVAAGLGFGVYPNPFVRTVTARFAAAAAGAYTVKVFDVTGRLVSSIEGLARGAGEVEVTWDGRDDEGDLVPAGMYFLRASSGGAEGIARVLLVR